MDVTESGMIIDVRELHPSNAYAPMDVTELPRVTEAREVHPLNA